MGSFYGHFAIESVPDPSSDKILSQQNFPPSNEVNRNSSDKTGPDQQKEEKGFSSTLDELFPSANNDSR